MTPDEKAIARKLGECMREMSQLPVLHECDQEDFAFAIHAAQNIILARDGLREMQFEDRAANKRPIGTGGKSTRIG